MPTDIDRVLEAADAETLRRMVRVLAMERAMSSWSKSPPSLPPGVVWEDVCLPKNPGVMDKMRARAAEWVAWAEAEARRSLSQAEVSIDAAADSSLIVAAKPQVEGGAEVSIEVRCPTCGGTREERLPVSDGRWHGGTYAYTLAYCTNDRFHTTPAVTHEHTRAEEG